MSSDVGKKQGDALRAIDLLCKKAKKDSAYIAGIAVITGPGQFSALRTGIAIANAFGYALSIPVVGVSKNEAMDTLSFIRIGIKKLKRKKRFSPIMPEYGKEPNITEPNK